MLLTLNAACLRAQLTSTGRKKAAMDLLDLPLFTKQTLGLGGLNLTTDLLAGADRARLEKVRERTDKAACSCLLLIEPEPQRFGEASDAKAEAASERTRRVIEAAHLLGCSAASIQVMAEDDEAALNRVAARLKPVVERAEKLDLNLLISPMKGLTARPERVTELLKKIGGFRIGTFPDFEFASTQKEPAAYLHRLTPYATVVSASTRAFTATPKKRGTGEDLAHEPYDLEAMVHAIEGVGYDGPMAIDYRGDGDPTTGIIRSRTVLQVAMGEGPLDLDDLEAELAEEDGNAEEDAGDEE